MLRLNTSTGSSSNSLGRAVVGLLELLDERAHPGAAVLDRHDPELREPRRQAVADDRRHASLIDAVVRRATQAAKPGSLVVERQELAVVSPPTR